MNRVSSRGAAVQYLLHSLSLQDDLNDKLIPSLCGTIQDYLTCSKVARAKLYTTKTPITTVDLLSDQVLPLFASQSLLLLRILTSRGTEYCSKAESHDYQLYLAMNDIDHTKIKAKSLQTNGICERFHKTILQEFHAIAFRKTIFESIDQLQNELDLW